MLRSVLAPIALAMALTGAARAESPKPGEGARIIRANDGEKGVPADKAEFMRRFDARFKTIDQNGDGSVTKEELVAGRKRGNPERAARMFEMLDRDRDGKVTQSEWHAAGEKIHERRMARKGGRGAASSPPPASGEKSRDAPGSE